MLPPKGGSIEPVFAQNFVSQNFVSQDFVSQDFVSDEFASDVDRVLQALAG